MKFPVCSPPCPVFVGLHLCHLGNLKKSRSLTGHHKVLAGGRENNEKSAAASSSSSSFNLLLLLLFQLSSLCLKNPHLHPFGNRIAQAIMFRRLECACVCVFHCVPIKPSAVCFIQTHTHTSLPNCFWHTCGDLPGRISLRAQRFELHALALQENLQP